MIFVLDTGFFLYGLDRSGMEGECVISQGVKNEVLNGFPARKLEYYLESGVIRIISPDEKSLKKVRGRALLTGDSVRLSETDISVIALALELNGKIVTDDYAIQNVARRLGIDYLPLKEKGIKDVWKWTYRCTGCGRFFEEYHEVCPICGSSLKTVPRAGTKNLHGR